MPFANKNELEGVIADYLNRNDLTQVIPDFIRLFECEVNDNLRTWRMLKRYEGVFTKDIDIFDLPEDWLETFTLTITGKQPALLTLVSIRELNEHKENLSTLFVDSRKGMTEYAHVAIEGDAKIVIYPEYNKDVNYELFYYAKIPALLNTTDTNWLLNNYPDLYLYGSLLHSATYLRDDERLTSWNFNYQNSIDRINSKSDNALSGGSFLRLRKFGLTDNTNR